MDDPTPYIENDPVYNAGFNDALEWAARWITSALGGYGDEVVAFAKANAESLRANKRPIQQQSFFDAIRNDPVMPPQLKAYWLALEKKQ